MMQQCSKYSPPKTPLLVSQYFFKFSTRRSCTRAQRPCLCYDLSMIQRRYDAYLAISHQYVSIRSQHTFFLVCITVGVSALVFSKDAARRSCTRAQRPRLCYDLSMIQRQYDAYLAISHQYVSIRSQQT